MQAVLCACEKYSTMSLHKSCKGFALTFNQVVRPQKNKSSLATAWYKVVDESWLVGALSPVNHRGSHQGSVDKRESESKGEKVVCMCECVCVYVRARARARVCVCVCV